MEVGGSSPAPGTKHGEITWKLLMNYLDMGTLLIVGALCIFIIQIMKEGE